MKHLLTMRKNEDNAFMGPTHALSGVAVFLLVLAFIPTFSSKFLFDNLFITIAFAIIFVGSALLPDFDNTRSTVISVLGIIGQGMSTSMRAIARIVYSLTRSKYDKPGADPHRGFWHTIVAGVSIGGLIYLATTSLSIFQFNLFGREVTAGTLLTWSLLVIFSQIVFAVFLKKAMKRLSNIFLGSLVGWIVSGILSASIVINLPINQNYLWVWIAIAGGWIVHILGDTLTTSGTPLLFPIPHKGHRWWNWRLPPYIKANGPVEHYIFVPLFFILIAVALLKLVVL